MYRRKGVPSLYPWQVEALSTEGVADGRSFVYCAPTSGGKSLVAEALLLAALQRSGRGVLVALPFVSLCDERAKHLSDLCEALPGTRVHKYYGHYGGPLPSGNLGIIVATYEKAHSIVKRLIEANRLHELGCVAVDEVHMLSEGSRGAQLELLLTMLLYMSKTEAALAQAAGGALLSPVLASQIARSQAAKQAGRPFDGWCGAAARSARARDAQALTRARAAAAARPWPATASS